MNKTNAIKPEFVEFIPKVIEDGTLYISKEYGTASHNCACGCGMRVVTPLTPTDWKVRVWRGTVSLSPSIGNWDYPCKSHYWIRNNEIVWAPSWSAAEIAAGRRLDREAKEKQYSAPELGWLKRFWLAVLSRFTPRD